MCDWLLIRELTVCVSDNSVVYIIIKLQKDFDRIESCIDVKSHRAS